MRERPRNLAASLGALWRAESGDPCVGHDPKRPLPAGSAGAAAPAAEVSAAAAAAASRSCSCSGGASTSGARRCASRSSRWGFVSHRRFVYTVGINTPFAPEVPFAPPRNILTNGATTMVQVWWRPCHASSVPWCRCNGRAQCSGLRGGAPASRSLLWCAAAPSCARQPTPALCCLSD